MAWRKYPPAPRISTGQTDGPAACSCLQRVRRADRRPGPSSSLGYRLLVQKTYTHLLSFSLDKTGAISQICVSCGPFCRAGLCEGCSVPEQHRPRQSSPPDPRWRLSRCCWWPSCRRWVNLEPSGAVVRRIRHLVLVVPGRNSRATGREGDIRGIAGLATIRPQATSRATPISGEPAAGSVRGGA